MYKKAPCTLPLSLQGIFKNQKNFAIKEYHFRTVQRPDTMNFRKAHFLLVKVGLWINNNSYKTELFSLANALEKFADSVKNRIKALF